VRALLVLLALAGAAGSSAQASRARPSDGPPDLVEKAYSAAEEKRYCDAIPLFLALHERAPQAKHLYRAAEVANAAGDRRLAIDLYRSVLESYPKFEKKKLVEERMRSLELAVKAQGPGEQCPDPAKVCGDWIVRPGEQCDDGNLTDGDGCDANCTLSVCGNGIRTAPEACDDGNVLDGDGCDGNCTVSACGNGVVAGREECDDGNTLDGDGCDHDCTASRCGNGVLAPDEQCDDGNDVSGDGCDRNCQLSSCGNGALQPGEECDDGNTLDGDGCDRGCLATRCGNGIVTAGESCDDGNTADGDGCDRNCTPTRCGNGVQTIGEQCDDGNTDDGDGCSGQCVDTEGSRVLGGALSFTGSVALVGGVTLGVLGLGPVVEHAQKSAQIDDLERHDDDDPVSTLRDARLLQSQIDDVDQRWRDVGLPLTVVAGAVVLAGTGLLAWGVVLWANAPDEEPAAPSTEHEERVP
jgi:cysteine-rich repeat protein